MREFWTGVTWVMLKRKTKGSDDLNVVDTGNKDSREDGRHKSSDQIEVKDKPKRRRTVVIGKDINKYDDGIKCR